LNRANNEGDLRGMPWEKRNTSWENLEKMPTILIQGVVGQKEEEHRSGIA